MTDKRPPRLLIVSHYFAPSANTSGKRVTRLARLLAGKGSPPAVVTCGEELYGDRLGGTSALRDELETYEVRPRGVSGRPAQKSWPVRQFVKAAFMTGYHRAIGCALASTEERPDFLFFRGVPFWYFPSAPVHSRRWGIPYVLDLGDVWHMGGVAYSRWQRRGPRSIVDSACEAWSVARASLVVLTTREQTELYRTRYASHPRSRFMTVRWGYDREVLSNLNPAEKPPAAFRVVISGSFTRYRPELGGILARGIRGCGETERVEVLHVGHPEPALEGAFRRAGLSACLRTYGVVPYGRAMEILASADCAVACPLSPLSLPVKLYDYIGLNRPVLAFSAQDTAMERLLESFPGAFIVEGPGDVTEALNRMLRGEVTELQDGLDTAPYSQERQFDRLLERLTLLLRPSLRAGHG